MEYLRKIPPFELKFFRLYQVLASFERKKYPHSLIYRYESNRRKE